jgi:hypothetical protein
MILGRHVSVSISNRCEPGVPFSAGNYFQIAVSYETTLREKSGGRTLRRPTLLRSLDALPLFTSAEPAKELLKVKLKRGASHWLA